MQQRVLAHFELLVNEKYFAFSFTPGLTNFDDIDEALKQFKANVDDIRLRAEEADRKAQEEAKATISEPEVAV